MMLGENRFRSFTLFMVSINQDLHHYLLFRSPVAFIQVIKATLRKQGLIVCFHTIQLY